MLGWILGKRRGHVTCPLDQPVTSFRSLQVQTHLVSNFGARCGRSLLRASAPSVQDAKCESRARKRQEVLLGVI